MKYLKNIDLKKSLEKINSLKKEDYYPISAFFGFVLGFLLFIFYSPNHYSGNKDKHIFIPRGAGFATVADTLYSNGIINNIFTFKVAAFISGADKNIKAGRYKIPNNLNHFRLLDLFEEGAPEEQKLVTIHEGIWQHNLAKILSDELGIDSSRVMELSYNQMFLRNLGIDANTLEGYLLPETYYFYTASSAEEVLKKLKSECDKLFDDDAKKQMRKIGMTKHEILTLASVIDGESNHLPEFKRISGVYHNRLKKRMLLQADPTIQYLIRHKKRRNRVLFKDLEIDSPYNTYIYAGLPPGPINNPGRDAIEAALYPEKHDLLYFVAAGDGTHRFAKTNSQHNLNVKKYREWRRRQK